jgi:hypothetical protein
MTHGLRSTYTVGKCRCEACCAANTRFARARYREASFAARYREGLERIVLRCEPGSLGYEIAVETLGYIPTEELSVSQLLAKIEAEIAETPGSVGGDTDEMHGGFK